MTAPPSLLIVENDPATLEFLKNTLGQAGYQTFTAPSGKEGLIEAWRNRPEMIILELGLPDLGGLEVTRKLRSDSRTTKTKIIIFSEQAELTEITAARQAGADEYIVKRAGADAELLERVQALLPIGGEPKPNEAAKPAGKLISFLSAKGGTGTSSVCANMAQLLAELEPSARVAVVDLVLPIGSISQIVGAKSAAAEQSIVKVTQLPPEKITSANVEAALVNVASWKFHLLPGAPDPASAQALEVGRLEAVFKVLQQAFDYVLVDFGRALSRISLPFIRHSARVVLIVSADISTVALTKTTLNYLETQNVLRNRIYPLLNRAVGLEGMNRAEIEKELALPIPGMIPYIGGDFALANNLHQPLAVKFPKATASFALQQFTQELLARLKEAVPQHA